MRRRFRSNKKNTDNSRTDCGLAVRQGGRIFCFLSALICIYFFPLRYLQRRQFGFYF